MFILAAAMIALTAFPIFLSAQYATQADPTDPALPPIDQSGFEYEIPPLEGGSPYPYPIISYEAPDAAELAGVDAPDQVTIDVWYGSQQTFGALGTPQEWINILGNVSGPSPITSLSYSLNGGPDQPLSIGGTTMARLYRQGDFNVEIHYTDLNDGLNTVQINASDGSDSSQTTVTVNYVADSPAPLPFTVDWGSGNAQQLLGPGHPVDGLWDIVSGELVNVLPGYDRLYTIGDMEWTNYEVTVPVTVTSLNTAEWGAPSYGAAVGVIVRWQGHTPGTTPAQPMPNWRRIGALAWYRWIPNGDAAFQMLGNGGGMMASAPAPGAIELNKTYIFKTSVKSPATEGARATYRFKYWQQGTTEPVEWLLTSRGNWGEPASGSILLAAHQAMARFGDVTITPIADDVTFTISRNQPANGEIIITPDKPSYEYGETVQIRVQGDPGYGLKNWTNSFSGNKNPLVFDITKNITIGAVMETQPQPTLSVSTEGQGTVKIEPDKTSTSYLYGEQVTLTAQPASGYKFSGWGGHLTGLGNPATIVMDRSKDIIANFVLSNSGSPISDDFSGCQFNTGLWSFINPLNDGSFQTNGSQLMLNVPAGVSHNLWVDGNNSVRMMQPTQDANFEIATKFDSQVTQRFQMQGILVEQDADNYLRFEVHHTGSTVLVYAVSFKDGDPTVRINNIPLPSTPPYLRVTRPVNSWEFSYSFDGESWEKAGTFSHTMTVTKTGVFAGNHGDPPSVPIPAHTAIVDYFFNTASPIDPEDGSSGGFEITTNVVGEGTIDLDPPQSPYACDQIVTVRAIPNPGWIFTGWSGDLSGSNPTQQIVVSRSHTITATFIEETVIEDGYKVYLPMGIR